MRQSFKSYWVATSALAVVLSSVAATAAWAEQPQSQPDASASEVVVTGFRSSLKGAQVLKQQAVGAEDVILAQDIVAFPDLNLAESLQRVPGVTISRDSGEGRQITLRGLGPDFTRTQLNGMEVLGNTASGMDNRGGVSRTRDRSVVHLNADSRVSVRFSARARDIRLDRGEARFDVAHNPAQPFTVAAGDVSVVAVGTVFGVERVSGAVEVRVFQGAVHVDQARQPERLLRRGQWLTLDPDDDFGVAEAENRSRWQGISP